MLPSWNAASSPGSDGGGAGLFLRRHQMKAPRARRSAKRKAMPAPRPAARPVVDFPAGGGGFPEDVEDAAIAVDDPETCEETMLPVFVGDNV